MQIFREPNINFFRWRWQAIGVSTLLIVTGLATMWFRGGLPLGIDFSGGTAVVVRFDEHVPEEAGAGGDRQRRRREGRPAVRRH